MDTKTLSELFISRAQAVAARVTVVADEAAAERAVAEERAGSGGVGVVRAAVNSEGPHGWKVLEGVVLCHAKPCQSCPTLFATPWTVTRQAPLSMRFSR